MEKSADNGYHVAPPVLKKRILIVEDQFIEAHDLQLILEKANYEVTGIARSVELALEQIELEKPDLVFLDIMLKGSRNGIELAYYLKEKYIGFIFISANSSKSILDQAKTTHPYGFIVKPFRDQDVLTTLEIAFYRQQYSLESQLIQQFQLQKEITEIINSNVKSEDALLAFAKAIQTYIPFDYLETGFVTSTHYANLGIIRKNIDLYQIIDAKKLSQIAVIPEKELNETYKKSKVDKEPIIYSEESLIKNFQEAPIKAIWDNKGKTTTWSNTAYWQMGLLEESDWIAKWISPDFKEDDNRPSPLLRKEFTISKKIKSATAYITSHGLYEAQINGKKIGDKYFTPGWTSYNKRLQYQVYDVTNMFETGNNAIAVILGNGWYRGYFH